MPSVTLIPRGAGGSIFNFTLLQLVLHYENAGLDEIFSELSFDLEFSQVLAQVKKILQKHFGFVNKKNTISCAIFFGSLNLACNLIKHIRFLRKIFNSGRKISEF
jgi:hypothetical protein